MQYGKLSSCFHALYLKLFILSVQIYNIHVLQGFYVKSFNYEEAW